MKKSTAFAVLAVTVALAWGAALSGCGPGSGEDAIDIDYEPEPGMTADQRILGECNAIIEKWVPAELYNLKEADGYRSRLTIFVSNNMDVFLRAAGGDTPAERRIAACATPKPTLRSTRCSAYTRLATRIRRFGR